MLDSIKNVDLVSFAPSKLNSKKQDVAKVYASSKSFYSIEAAKALKLNSLNFARTLAFAGSLAKSFEKMNKSMVTCRTNEFGGENAGKRVSVNKLVHEFQDDFYQLDDAVKSTIRVDYEENSDKPPIYARAQIKKVIRRSELEDTDDLLFQMAVRDNSASFMDRTSHLKQQIDIISTPINYKGQGTKEQAYVLNTKGNLMAVVEDGDDVILTNAGTLSKKNIKDGVMEITARQWFDKKKLDKQDENDKKTDKDEKEEKPENKYDSFIPSPQPVRLRTPMPSEGEGTEIIIGMENGRFVDEVKASIVEFVEKVKRGEIVLDKFVANKNAKSTQLVMLAGGFGSRAEYTNASSSAIFHNAKDGTQSTKGIFRTATGLTPMETSFITLHNAGLLDCSKDALEIGKNIKFYLNKDINKGSGQYTLNLVDTMKRDDAKSIMVLPNDSMSRMTNAVIQAKELVDSGKAAVAMITKKIKAEDCINTFGIIRLGKDNQIEEFKEKPESIEQKFIIGKENNDSLCLTNTFQFVVSNETLKVMELVEPFYNFPPEKKETRDWSKNYIPVIQAITMYDDPNEIRKFFRSNQNIFGKDARELDDETIRKAKEILHGQKLYAVPTSEPWADCGTLNQLYMTTMQIASGVFQLEDFERAHVLSCVDAQKGLVASSKEQKERILNKYNLSGQVMVVPQARHIDKEKIKDIEVTVHEKTK